MIINKTLSSTYPTFLLNLLLNQQIYFAFGKSTAWPDDNLPPTPPTDLISPLEPLIYKRAELTSLANPTTCTNPNQVVLEGIKYSFIQVPSSSEPYSIYSKNLYLRCTLLQSEYPSVELRSISICVNPEFTSPSTNLVRPANQIKFPGYLIYNIYSSPISLSAQQKFGVLLTL